MLSWSVTGASAVSIDGGIGGVAAAGTRSVSPTATTTWRLTATNGSSSATASVTVPVVYVSAFTASPSPVASGGAVTLSWTAAGASGISIDKGVGAVSGTSVVVHPVASTTYTLTATNGPASFAIAATVTVNPPSPQPLISAFAADAPFVVQGGSTTLRWTTTAPSVTWSPGGVYAGTGSVAVSPAATTTYTLSAGPATASATVTVGQGTWVSPGTPAGTPAVTFTLDSRSGVHPISPLIYGYNAASRAEAPPGASLLRLGGNRWTAYDWETNASNAGSDYRLRAKIDADWPGTRIAFTEYSHGGGNDISGAVAQAETLGIFGREGVYAATNWPVNGDERYIFGAFRSFRNFDGAGGAFGDTAFSALSSDESLASVYSSFDAASPDGRVVVVAVNKTAGTLPARLRLTHTRAFAGARVYQLTASTPYDGASVVPQRLADLAASAANAFDVSLPGYSITTLVLVP